MLVNRGITVVYCDDGEQANMMEGLLVTALCRRVHVWYFSEFL